MTKEEVRRLLEDKFADAIDFIADTVVNYDGDFYSDQQLFIDSIGLKINIKTDKVVIHDINLK